MCCSRPGSSRNPPGTPGVPVLTGHGASAAPMSCPQGPGSEGAWQCQGHPSSGPQPSPCGVREHGGLGAQEAVLPRGCQQVALEGEGPGPETQVQVPGPLLNPHPASGPPSAPRRQGCRRALGAGHHSTHVSLCATLRSHVRPCSFSEFRQKTQLYQPQFKGSVAVRLSG